MDFQQLADSSPDDSFVKQFWDSLSPDVAATWARVRTQPTGRTRASWHTRGDNGDLVFNDIADYFATAPTDSVVIVEGIDLAWMLQIGKYWNIAPALFIGHAHDVAKGSSNPWDPVLQPDVRKSLAPPVPTDVDIAALDGHQKWSMASVWHLDGCLTPAKNDNAVREETINFIQRQQAQDMRHRANISTRISAWDSRKSRDFHFILMLVDGPYVLKVAGQRQPAELHVPLAETRGGLMIPQLASQQTYRIFECLQSFLSHSWHFNALFGSRTRGVPVIRPDSFAYLLAASTWETNLRHADERIKHISFEEMRDPSTSINNRLHALRKELDYLREGVTLAKQWMPGPAQRPLRHLKVEFAENITLPLDSFADMKTRAVELQKFLMDTFTLLLSSISIKEAELGVQQSMSTQRLTLLASIYVPLSFVTGIFGMNVAEIDGSPLSIWVFVVTLAGTMLLTAIAFAVYSQWQRQRRRGKI